MTYKYTHQKSVDSSAIEEVYYNANDRSLYLVMTGGSGYRYKDVTLNVYRALVDSNSVGRYYANNIKSNYGPGEYLGYFNDSDEEFEWVSTSYLVQNESNTAYVVPPTTSGTGMPQSLTYRANAQAVRSNYTVTFECNGKVREHNVEATSLDEAIVFVQSFAEMLELNFKVKSVTVHFE